MKENKDFDFEFDQWDSVDPDDPVDQRVEEIFKAFAYELGENTAAYARAVLDENQPDPPLFMDEPEVEAPKEEPEALEIKPYRSRRVLRRSLILVAVLVLVMGLVVVTSEGVRLKLSSLFCGDAPASTRLVDDSKLVVDLESVEVGYVPDGFAVVGDETLGDYSRMIGYEDENETRFVVSIIKTNQYVNNVDNERNESEELLIDDKEGFFFYDDSQNIIIWQIGDCTLQLTSLLEKDELHKIAKSITVN